jgi:putative ABC transport system substrate-binding protein
MIRRREFITLVGGAAAWPIVAHGQQGAIPVIGFVYPGTPELSTGVVAAFRKGLGEAGFVEGRNVAVELRFAYGDNRRLPELTADLVQRRVAVIVTPGSTQAALAAKAATSSIPVVFGVGTDPVEIGLVASLSRPGGNVTGITSLNSELAAKRLALMVELLPKAMRFAVLVNPSNRNAEALRRRPPPPSGARSRFWRPAHHARSMKPLRARWPNAPTRSWSAPNRCLTTVVCNLSRWRHTNGSPRSMRFARTSKLAAS